jgi:hypothetical protein
MPAAVRRAPDAMTPMGRDSDADAGAAGCP